MILVERLCIVYTSVQSRHEELRHPDECLQPDQDVGDESEDGMRRDEVCSVVRELVVLDDYQSGNRCEERKVVECRVCVGSILLLLGSMCGLHDEDALDEEERGGGVEERVEGEKRKWCVEDGAPDDGCEL